MPMWPVIERVSWLVGIVGAVLALVSLFMQGRATRNALYEQQKLILTLLDRDPVPEELPGAAEVAADWQRKTSRWLVVSASSVAVTVVAVLLAFTALLSVTRLTNLRLVAGDQPQEENGVVCGSGGCDRPPTGYRWTIGAGDHDVDAVLTPGLDRDFYRFTGQVNIARANNCETATVHWRIEVNGAPVASAVDTARFEVAVPNDVTHIRLLVNRTDEEYCSVDVSLVDIGLDFHVLFL
jgi:hypothetical protein